MTATIIVPLDGSDFAERALVPAAALAKRTGADVTLMTSIMGGVVVEPERYLADAAAKAGIAAAHVAVITDHGAATGLQLLVAEAQDPIVCMSTHGHSGVVQALIGSTAEEAVRLLRVPMLLLGPSVELSLATRLDSVVVCTDGTHTSKAIVPEVSNWIRDLRLRAWVVQVLDPEARRELEEIGEDPVVEFSAVRALAETLLTTDGAGINWDVVHSDHAAHRDRRPRLSRACFVDRDVYARTHRPRPSRVGKRRGRRCPQCAVPGARRATRRPVGR